jgi:hypothetical protein
MASRELPPMTTARRGSLRFAFAPNGQTVIVARSAGRDLEVGGFDLETGVSMFHHVLDRSGQVRDYRLISGGAVAILVSPEDATAWEVATGRHLAAFGRCE